MLLMHQTFGGDFSLRQKKSQELKNVFSNEPPDIRTSVRDALFVLRAPQVRCVEIVELRRYFMDRNAEPFEQLLAHLSTDESPEVAALAQRELTGLQQFEYWNTK